MKKSILYIVNLLFLVIIFAFTSSAGKDLKSQLENLSGTYTDAKPYAYGKGFGKRVFTFEKGNWTLNFTFSLDPEMKRQVFQFRTFGTYKVQGKSSKVANSYNAIFNEEKKLLTLKTSDENLVKAFGFTPCNMMKDVEQDVSETGCSGWKSVAECPGDHDLLSLDKEGKLYFGSRPQDNNMCSPDKRPTSLTPPVIKSNLPRKSNKMPMSNKQKVQELYKSFETGDPSAAQLYLMSDYIQHNPNIGNGIDGFSAVMKNKPPQGFKANIIRIFEDGDYVITHSDYDFFGKKIGFGIFRFEKGQVAEHWDNLVPIQPKNQSGRTQLDGEINVVDKDKTALNKTIIKNFADDILIGGKMEKIGNYQIPDFHQHNPNMADGIKGLGDAFAYFQQQGLLLQITKIHKILGEGNFVLVVSEGKFGKGDNAAFYDLFRLADGKITEHWDVIEPIPTKENWKNNNGKF